MSAEQVVANTETTDATPKRRQNVARIEPRHVPATPMEMLAAAVNNGATVEVLEKLLALQERWEAGQARKAFDAAMSEAKSEIPVISKNRAVDFTSAKGRTNYRYEDLGEIARVVSPILAKYGLSYRFRTSAELNAPVIVTCVISHRDGHYEENSLPGPRDESGNKNAIQAIGSTLTYLQRMTLKAALGLAASDDDDGETAAGPATITAEQAEDLRIKLANAGANEAKFIGAMQAGSLEQIPAKRYDEAVQRIVHYIQMKQQKQAAPQ